MVYYQLILLLYISMSFKNFQVIQMVYFEDDEWVSYRAGSSDNIEELMGMSRESCTRLEDNIEIKEQLNKLGFE